jgi:GT2 family glycosyltransferase
MPAASVIIPAYNRADLLAQAMESVLAQTMADLELIVVDDGSTDNTPAVLASYGDKLIALRQDNAGPGAARNAGIARAAGRYVCFLDSDDLWFPWTANSYQRMIDAHRRTPSSSPCSGRSSSRPRGSTGSRSASSEAS